jgi:hypothetical protein
VSLAPDQRSAPLPPVSISDDRHIPAGKALIIREAIFAWLGWLAGCFDSTAGCSLFHRLICRGHGPRSSCLLNDKTNKSGSHSLDK